MGWMLQRKVEKEESPAQNQEAGQDGVSELPFVHGAGYIKLKGIPFFATKDDVLEFLGDCRPSSDEHIRYRKADLGGTGEAFVMLENKEKAMEAVTNKNGKTMLIDTIEVTHETYDPPANADQGVINPDVSQGIMNPDVMELMRFMGMGGGEPDGEKPHTDEPLYEPIGQPSEPRGLGVPLDTSPDEPAPDAPDVPVGHLFSVAQGGTLHTVPDETTPVPELHRVPGLPQAGLQKVPQLTFGSTLRPEVAIANMQNQVNSAKARMAKIGSKMSGLGEVPSQILDKASKMKTSQVVSKEQDRKQDRSRSREKASSASSSKHNENTSTTADSEDRFLPMQSKKELVSRVNEWRKLSSQGKRQWIAWVDEKGTDGKRDPAFYDAAFLEDFLDHAIKGSTAAPAGKEQEFEQQYEQTKTDPLHESLVLDIKRRQRGCDAFKDRWHEYCFKHGGGHVNPQRHDAAFLQSFITMEDAQLRLVAATCPLGRVVELFGPQEGMKLRSKPLT